MSTEQFKAWDEIEKKWRAEKFMPFLKKENIKMNCANCTAVYIWVVFKSDSTGTKFTMIKNKKCGDEFKGKQLNEVKKMIEEIKLPEVFWNTFLKVHLGNGLKC